MSDAADAMLVDSAMRTLVLRDVVAMMLAAQASASGNADGLLRQIAAGLDQRLAALEVRQERLIPHVEHLRQEYDWIIAAARSALLTEAEARESV